MSTPVRRSSRSRKSPSAFVAGQETGEFHDGIPGGLLTSPLPSTRMAKSVPSSSQSGRGSPHHTTLENDLTRHALKFQGDPWRGTGLVAGTFAGLALVWVAAASGIFHTALLPVFAALWAGLAVRSFMLFHDCGHRSFVGPKHPWLNAVLFEVAAVMCMTPADWSIGHQVRDRERERERERERGMEGRREAEPA